MPPESMIDKSRKKDHYFDTDYSPFLIEDDDEGILRIPSSRAIKDAVPCENLEFLDFVDKCLEIDPEVRFSASEAMEHPWVKSGLEDSLRQGKISDNKVVTKQKPLKRMGTGESPDVNLTEPKILPNKEFR